MTATIQVNGDGQFSLVGDINFYIVPELYKRGCQLISASSQSIFDFRTVVSSDNAGLTLLVSWARYARNINRKIQYINLPQRLFDIIKASNLENILPIA